VTAEIIQFPTAVPGSATAPDGTEPESEPTDSGTLLQLIITCLEDAGITAHCRGRDLIIRPRRKPRSRKQARATGAALWTLTIGDGTDDGAGVHLSFDPWAGRTSDPLWIASIAAALLTGTSTPLDPRPGTFGVNVIGIKGVAGLHLRHHGFAVELNPYLDDHTLELNSDVSVTTAEYDVYEVADPGIVYISDSGTVYYERTFGQSTVRLAAGDRAAPLPVPSAVARDIAATVTAALNAARLQRAEG
jgi:hypothetical protein